MLGLCFVIAPKGDHLLFLGPRGQPSCKSQASCHIVSFQQEDWMRFLWIPHPCFTGCSSRTLLILLLFIRYKGSTQTASQPLREPESHGKRNPSVPRSFARGPEGASWKYDLVRSVGEERKVCTPCTWVCSFCCGWGGVSPVFFGKGKAGTGKTQGTPPVLLGPHNKHRHTQKYHARKTSRLLLPGGFVVGCHGFQKKIAKRTSW